MCACVGVWVCVWLHIVDFLVAKHINEQQLAPLHYYYFSFLLLLNSLFATAPPRFIFDARPGWLHWHPPLSAIDILVEPPPPSIQALDRWYYPLLCPPGRIDMIYDFLIFNWTAHWETLANANCALRCAVVQSRIRGTGKRILQWQWLLLQWLRQWQPQWLHRITCSLSTWSSFLSKSVAYFEDHGAFHKSLSSRIRHVTVYVLYVLWDNLNFFKT